MNKSKFLKKSLAMVLAVMMIVAMIPLGASAAATPKITRVTVNGVEAKLSGDTYTATIVKPTTGVTANITLEDGVGSVYHDNNDAPNVATQTTTITFTADEVDARAAEFVVFDSDLNEVGAYKVKFEIAANNTDTSVKSVSIANQYGSTKVEGKTFTIVVPYEATMTDKNATIVLNSATSTIDAPASQVTAGKYTLTIDEADITAGNGTDFTVTSQAGTSVTYTIKVVRATAFSSFSVKDQRKDAGIGGITDGVTDKTIEVYMPYGTKTNASGAYKFTPTFTTGYSSVTVKAVKTDGTTEVALESGKEINLADFASLGNSASIGGAVMNLKVNYTHGATEDWKVNFDVPTDDPVPAIKSLKISNFVAKIDGRNITIDVPATVRDSATDIVIGASTGSKVEVVESNPTIDDTAVSDEATLTSTAGWLADGNNKFILRVTAPGKDDVTGTKLAKDYYLTINTADAKPAQVVSMVLEDKNDSTKQYKAAIDQTKNTITFPVPYSIKNAIDLEDWILYWEVTSGATAVSNGTPLDATGSALAGTEGWLPAGAPGYDGKTAGTDTIVVETAGLTSKTYTVYLKNNAASKAATMTGFTITTASKYEDITDGNSYKVNGSKDLSITIPYSKYADYKASYVAAELSENSSLWYVDDTGVLQTLEAMSKDDASTAVTTHLPDVTGSIKYDGETKVNGKLTPLTLIVTSEAIEVDPGTTPYDDNFKKVNRNLGYTAYTFTLKKAVAKGDAAFTKISILNNATKETVNGVIKDNDITFTLPYNFDVTKAGAVAALYLDYAVKGGDAVVKLNGSDATNPLVYKADGTLNTDDSEALVATYDAAGAHKLTYGASTTLATISVTSEDGKTVTPYNVYVKFASPEKGAELTSVKIGNVTARPSGNKVTVNLPYGSEITHLKPVFTVSKNAYVKDSFNDTVVDQAYNFTTPQTFKVWSEDGQNSSTYVITVTTDEQFKDVKTTDWFYQDVMDGVAAGIIAGKGNGIFDPYGKVTREQFAQFIARADGYDKDAYLEKKVFSDVPSGTDGSAAIAYCHEKGYISGMGDTTFAPKATITREQMAIIICKVMDMSPVSTPKATFADDAQISSWAKPYVYACYEGGILSGKGQNKYDPKGTTTRAEAASVIMRTQRAK